jgi:lysozyme
MINMKRMREQLILHEGLKLTPYRCTSDKLTIGVGRNLDDRGISEETAMQMLDEDINIVHGELLKLFPSFSDMPEIVQESLVDLAFNMGTPTLMKFKATVAALNSQQWTIAADELLDSRYARQVGQRAQTIADNIRSCA